MDTESGDSLNTRMANAMEILAKDEDDKDTGSNANDPAASGDTGQPEKDATGEDQDKPTDEGKDEQQTAAIEPPASWPSADKEAFNSLPTWTQELISRRESEREAHFAERAQTMAARERQVNETTQQATEAQNRYLNELQRVTQLASQLMPAKFSDIQNQADYLRMKVEDPARASEYEAFMQIMGNATQQQQQLQQQRMQAHVAKEYETLQGKFPEFKDNVKSNQIFTEIRKACVDFYGFTPQDVEVFADHRHIPIMRDAMAWRAHQANLKAAQSKKVPQHQPTKKIGSNGEQGASLASDQKAKILNRASKTDNLHDKAALIAATL